jgi:hypothetical protein
MKVRIHMRLTLRKEGKALKETIVVHEPRDS